MFKTTVLSVAIGLAAYLETGDIVTALWVWLLSGILIITLNSGLKRV